MIKQNYLKIEVVLATFCFILAQPITNIKLEFGVFSRTHTWPFPFLKSKVFFKKLIASYLYNDEQGEVTSEKYNQRDVIRKSINMGSL